MTVLGSFPDGVTALIQGASRGIGLEFCRQLAADSRVRRIVATCRRPESANALTALAGEHAHRLHVEALDVSDESSVADAAGRVRGHVGELDLVVNCAGILHTPDGMAPERRLTDVDPESLAHSFRVNALGPLLVAKHFSPLLPKKRRAVFASVSARVGSIGDNRLGGWYAYRGAKAAQNMFTRNLSIELTRRHRGLICVALHPGTTDTDLSRPFQKNVPEGKLFAVDRSVRYLLDVIDGLTPGDNGGFFAWDGQSIPW